MADNSLKTPFARSLNQVATQRAQDEIHLQGKALPASVVSVRGSIVKVKFELQSNYTLPQVTMPLAGSEYLRQPIQPGCKGVCFPADFYVGGVSGLGGGVAGLAQRGNLSTLVFFPIGNTGFSVVDGMVLTGYGPNGVTLRDQASNVIFLLTPTGIEVDLPGGAKFELGNGEGVGVLNLTITVTNGDVIADGISLKHHVHSGVQTGSGDTGPPVP